MSETEATVLVEGAVVVASVTESVVELAEDVALVDVAVASSVDVEDEEDEADDCVCWADEEELVFVEAGVVDGGGFELVVGGSEVEGAVEGGGWELSGVVVGCWADEESDVGVLESVLVGGVGATSTGGVTTGSGAGEERGRRAWASTKGALLLMVERTEKIKSVYTEKSEEDHIAVDTVQVLCIRQRVGGA